MFQSYTNRYRSPYEQSYSQDPLYYSLNVGREFESHPRMHASRHAASSLGLCPTIGCVANGEVRKEMATPKTCHGG